MALTYGPELITLLGVNYTCVCYVQIGCAEN
jgi:hypothetical protein